MDSIIIKLLTENEELSRELSKDLKASSKRIDALVKGYKDLQREVNTIREKL